MITAWLAGTDHGIVLHAGRSGAVIADVDYPDNVPEPLGAALAETGCPYQSTRPDSPGRGHYVFLMPPGRTLGNGLGKLPGGWGEIRGRNGVIAVEPTPHPDGGRYHWERTGVVPVLPGDVAKLLPDAGEAAEVATDIQVEAFLAAHTRARDPRKLDLTVEDMRKRIRSGESRHETALTKTCLAFREAHEGYFSARAAIERIGRDFTEAACKDFPGRKARTEASARSEYAGIVAWAVAQVAGAEVESAAPAAVPASGALGQLLAHAPDHDRRIVCLVESVLAAGTPELRHRLERASYEAGALVIRSPLARQAAELALYGAALVRLDGDPGAQGAISDADALALVRRMIASGLDDAAHGEARSTGSGEAKPAGGEITSEAVRVVETAGHVFGKASPKRAEEAAEPVVLPGVPRYPVGQLTGALADLVSSTTLPMCLVAGAGLGVLAGLCGPAALRMPDDSVQYPALWTALIGPAGAAKSPSLDYASRLVRELDAREHEKYRETLGTWLAVPKKDREGSPPSDPTRRIDDATLESVARWLGRGDGTGLVECDELSGWLQAIGQYRKPGPGGDKGRYLALWSCEPWRYMRVGEDRTGGTDLLIQRPVLSIVGGLQPHLHHLLGDEDSGFRPRWLVHVSPLESAEWAVRKYLPRDWDSAVRLLYENRDQREWTLAGSALRVWKDASRGWKLQARSGEESASASRALIKADIQCARIALVIAESLKPGAGGGIPTEAMKCAVAITEYVMDCWRALPGHETFALTFREEKLSRKLISCSNGWRHGTAGAPPPARSSVLTWAECARPRSATLCWPSTRRSTPARSGRSARAAVARRGPSSMLPLAANLSHGNLLCYVQGNPSWRQFPLIPLSPISRTKTQFTALSRSQKKPAPLAAVSVATVVWRQFLRRRVIPIPRSRPRAAGLLRRLLRGLP